MATLFNMLRYMGAVFGVTVGTIAFSNAGNFGSPEAFASGFRWTIGVGSVATLELRRSCNTTLGNASTILSIVRHTRRRSRDI